MNQSKEAISQHVTETYVDPVCGMNVDPLHAAGTIVYKIKSYFFCSPGCLKKFSADPEKFLHVAEKEVESNKDSKAEYTCPMHPEIVQVGPGSCPICGMALEPKIVSASQKDEEDPELGRREEHGSASLLGPVPQG